jgi:hypothetical protein
VPDDEIKVDPALVDVLPAFDVRLLQLRHGGFALPQGAIVEVGVAHQ